MEKLSQKSDFILQLFRLSNFSDKLSESAFNNSRLFQVQKIITLGARALLCIKRRPLEKIPRLNSILTISGKSILYSLCRNKNFQLKRRRDFSITSDAKGQVTLSRPKRGCDTSKAEFIYSIRYRFISAHARLDKRQIAVKFYKLKAAPQVAKPWRSADKTQWTGSIFNGGNITMNRYMKFCP